jgi:DNA uptake protein ComE-like DNA-binding protein
MALLGSMRLSAAMNVKRGERVKLRQLFTVEERRKAFTAQVDAPTGAKIKVNVAKLEPMETMVDLGSKKGEAASLWRLLKIWDLDRGLTASQDIVRGEDLEVTVETL